MNLPTPALAGLIDYSAVIEVRNGAGGLMGYVQDDPNYWTPQITPDIGSALIVHFTLNGTSGNQINLTPVNSGEAGYPFFGLVVGRDSTSSDIGPGNFNYLYMGNTNGTAPGSTAQNGNYYSANSGFIKPSESAIWNIDVNALTLIPAWVNSNSSTPTTVVFVQSNHVYGGGDSGAFLARYPAAVTDATLHLVIQSAVEQPSGVPEPASLSMMAVGVLVGGLVLRRRTNGRRRRSS